MPAGISTSRVRSSITRPAPLHCLALLLDQLPRARARRAGPRAHELPEHAARNLAHSAAASTGRARANRSVGLRPVPSATATGNGDAERHLTIGPRRHLGQVDLDPGGDVCAAPAAASPSAAEDVVAEERGEEIGEVAEVERCRLKATAAQTRVSEAVVELAPLGVGENLVGLDDLAEAMIGIRLVRHVGVHLAGEAAERALDLLGVRGSRHAEKLVVVALSRGHPQ